MRKRKNEKKEKELKRRYGKLAEGMEPYYHHLDLRPLDELDDDGFAFIMKNVKGVNMLDLNETNIGIESMALLAKLEYVKELRVKGCRNLTNDCAVFINDIKGLEFLHIKGTGITVDGLLQFSKLHTLNELLFSAEDISSITNKLLQLKQLLPGCAFVIDGKPYSFH